MRKITVSVFALAASVMVPQAPIAQMTWTDKGYVAVTVGGQAGSHTLTTRTEVHPLRGDGTLTTSQKAGGGAFVDLGGGYKVWHNLVLGLSYSHVGSSDADCGHPRSTVPVPRGRPPAAGRASYGENKRCTSARVWMVPVTDKIDVGVPRAPASSCQAGRPDRHDVTEPGPTVTSVISASTKKTVGGFHTGVDVTYLLTKKIGAGLIARYTFGSVDFPGATDSLTVGGFQFGVGLRYRF